MKGTRPLDNDDIRRVSTCFSGTYEVRNRGLFLLGVSTGGRISELLSLRITAPVHFFDTIIFFKGEHMKTNMFFYPCLCIIIFCFSSAGCGKTNYIVLRDVPQSPSFVVIPANNTIPEVSYANVIESAIIAAGVKVVLRPISKEIEKTITTPTNDGGSTNILTERYFELDELNAEYLVQTYVTPAQVKVSKLSTGEVLAIVNVYRVHRGQGGEDPRDTMLKVLSKLLGIKD